jgi:hypothetical protein
MSPTNVGGRGGGLGGQSLGHLGDCSCLVVGHQHSMIVAPQNWPAQTGLGNG